jgi:NTP pyrophosphatase (non-canonical NTP hydrolase)
MHFLEALRTANVARNEEWWGDATPATAMFRANELAGEAGEACNILKKLDRERMGLQGSRATIGALTEELADVVICCDLLGMHQKIEFPEATWGDYAPAEVDYSLLGVQLMARVGRICIMQTNEQLRKLLLPSALTGTVWLVKRNAGWLGIDLSRAVTTKFNMSSDKLGLKTKLVW